MLAVQDAIRSYGLTLFVRRKSPRRGSGSLPSHRSRIRAFPTRFDKDRPRGEPEVS